MGIFDRVRKAWNAFIANDRSNTAIRNDLGYSSFYRPDRQYFTKGNEKSIVVAVYNRIAIDCASVKFRHVRLDKNDRYIEDIDSNLNNCLSVEANKDQTARAFFQDVVQSLFDEGCVAMVPVDLDRSPSDTDSYEIYTMRVGRITQWYPDYVKTEVYNDRTGQKQEITCHKKDICIIENPLYSIMNEKNSVLQRLIRKLNLLDAIDEQSSSGKLDLIIQLPYIIKSEARKSQAETRRKDIEEQLNNSKYGIAYTDGTEKVTQLNRPVENNLMKQIEYLTSMVYSQLGMTQEILNGTAKPEAMANYMHRTIEPILDAINDEMNRKLLTQTARTQKQRIIYFSNPFKLMTINNLADIADKFTRNEIMSSNEFRQIIGMKPSKDPRADELRNKNISESTAQVHEEEIVNPEINKDIKQQMSNNADNNLAERLENLADKLEGA